ncbi:beta-ketoacyl-[acyl-carrier-protein] synthase III [Trifolium repens]|nr:beta-ketoacyl-[acyl-carrier-protein] synthase III [Trifolium repens]
MRGIWSMPMHGYINHPAKCHNLRERKPDCGLIACARNSEEYGLYGFDVHSDGSGLRHLNAGIRENESNNALDSNGSVWSFPPKQSLLVSLHLALIDYFSTRQTKGLLMQLRLGYKYPQNG